MDKSKPLTALTVASAGLLVMVANFEGNPTKPYRDVGGVPTVCAGVTRHVDLARTYTPEECAAMNAAELARHGEAIKRCIKVEISQPEFDAFQSFAYNVGVENFCASTLARKLNMGDRVSACDELLRWDKVNGKQVAGLTKRRHAERELCRRGLEGVA